MKCEICAWDSITSGLSPGTVHLLCVRFSAANPRALLARCTREMRLLFHARNSRQGSAPVTTVFTSESLSLHISGLSAFRQCAEADDFLHKQNSADSVRMSLASLRIIAQKSGQF